MGPDVEVGFALVTGASGGIGLEMARLLAADGISLALVARNVDRLNELADDLRSRYSIGVVVIPADLSDPGAPAAIFAEVQRRGITVTILINNAGFASYGFFSEAELATELSMIQVNVTALTQLTGLFLPGMLERQSGRIMNVASTAAFQPGPLMAVYYATKAFVLHFSEAIANELEGTGVRVTALCPGATESGFQSRARMEASKLVQGKLMSAATVARVGYQGMLDGKPVVIPGLWQQAMTMGPRILPRSWTTRFVRWVQERVK